MPAYCLVTAFFPELFFAGAWAATVEADLANVGELSELRYRYLRDEKIAVEKKISVAEEK